MSGEESAGAYSPGRISQEQVDSLLRNEPNEVLANAFIDLSSNLPKDATTQAQFQLSLNEKFELNLPTYVQRLWHLPPVILKRASDEYVRLLVEARELFTMGYFYSCVAMCGIVGEKLVKDVLRDAVYVSVNESPQRPSDEAFDQLERIDVSAIVRFLTKAQLLDSQTYKAADELVQLRNKYAHARGKNPETDALEAIRKLHLLLDGTVSVLKDYEIADGKLTRRVAKT